jgi:hypothetical protein
MDNVANSVLPEVPAVGYPRAMLDDFMAAADVERLRLEAAIVDAEQRGDEARVAIGSHEVMVSMLVDAHREISLIELDAHQRAAAILEAADREAREILRSAHGDLARTPAEVRASEPAIPTTPVVHPMTRLIDGPIDLTELETLDAGPERLLKSPVYANGNGNGEHDAAPGSDRYFDFLRGALVDDEPLGPRPE